MSHTAIWQPPAPNGTRVVRLARGVRVFSTLVAVSVAAARSTREGRPLA